MIYATYLPLIYLCFYLLALVVLANSHDWHGVGYLTLLYLVGWVAPVWGDARNLMLFDLLLFSFAHFFYLTSRGFVFAMIALAMILTNGLCLITGWHDFYRLSVVNLLFISLCFYTIITGYNTRKVHNNRGAQDNGIFMARALPGKKV